MEWVVSAGAPARHTRVRAKAVTVRAMAKVEPLSAVGRRDVARPHADREDPAAPPRQ